MSYRDYDILNDPVTNAEQKQRLHDTQAEQARTLREGLGAELFDWCDAFLESGDVLEEQ